MFGKARPAELRRRAPEFGSMRGSLIKDQRVFHEAYRPERFFNRDAELAAVRKALEPMAQRRRTRNLWLHGPPGTGKSSVAGLALNEIEERHGIRTAYLNSGRPRPSTPPSTKTREMTCPFLNPPFLF